jgi:serine/threonine protein kinase/tetratricopeptide (TPR) repeat protein
MRERDIFIEALQKESPADRVAYLHAACEGDTELRSRVERLLLEHERQHSFILDAPAVATEPGLPLDPPILLTPPGTVIGRYKILEPIGEGGYGTVFMAEQTTPVQRKVALKIIKAGMDTRQVIARFEAERQALALMDHPNIAKVFDAGVTETGRPYFVMELVKGMPITKYCDEHRLPPRQRLELFIQVCQAVQHAHQKGIIHRDLKPSNVLVAQYDGRPVPKVIDFGVAKATGQRLTLTMFTGFGDVIGTPQYMSPEQAELNQLDVDTRSDIYSLGVLLYELLTGSTPLESNRVKEAALLEVLRVVREEEPQRPSARLSTAEQLPSIAASRGLEPEKLSGLVKGELDWIVMRALEKDRTRRYETANGMASDVQRYLNDETVQACPPSALYRFRKFARRNKIALASSGLVLFFLVLVGSGIGWAVRDRTAREEQAAQQRSARQARVTEQLESILTEVARLEQAEKWSEADARARQAEPALAAGEATSDVQERVRQTLADLQLIHQLDEIRARSGTIWNVPLASVTAQADQEYAAALRQSGIDVDVLPVPEAVARVTARRSIAAALLPALDDWLAVRCARKDVSAAQRLSDVLRLADRDPWRQRVRDCLASKDWPALDALVTSADLDRQSAATLSFLYVALSANGKGRERALVLRRAQAKYPGDFWINHRLGVDLIWQQSPDLVHEGIGYMRAAVALRPKSSHAIMNLGAGYSSLRQYDHAISCYRRALELEPNGYGIYWNLGYASARAGSYQEAIAAIERGITLSRDAAEPSGEAFAQLAMILSTCPDARLRNPGRAAEAASRAVELEPQASNHWTALGVTRYRAGDWQQACIDFRKSLRLGAATPHGAYRWPDSIDWFFLAMSHWQMGRQDQARQYYNRAVQEMEKGQTWQTDVEQLARIRAEAEELLGAEE